MLLLFCSALLFNLSCQNTASPNSNTNILTNAAVEPANLPPGISVSPLPADSSSTPGIPDPANVNVNTRKKDGTPIPGIPDDKNLGKPLPKGKTPIPGIPDEKTFKEQMNKSAVDSNSAKVPPS